MNIEPYIIDKHRVIIEKYLDAKDYDNALEALGRLAEFYLGCMPVAAEDEKWK